MTDTTTPDDPIIRVVRTLEYVGPKSWVDATLLRSGVRGRVDLPDKAYIEETSCYVREPNDYQVDQAEISRTVLKPTLFNLKTWVHYTKERS